MKFSNDEIQAVQESLPELGEHVVKAEIGTKAFNDLSKDEVLGLVAATIKAFRKSLEAVYEKNDVPY